MFFKPRLPRRKRNQREQQATERVIPDQAAVAADFSPEEISEMRHALANSIYMMRRKLRLPRKDR